jgi:hypothetical protein
MKTITNREVLEVKLTPNSILTDANGNAVDANSVDDALSQLATQQ